MGQKIITSEQNYKGLDEWLEGKKKILLVCMGMIGAFVLKLPVLAVAFILTLDEFVKIPAVYKHYMKYNWVKNITKEETT